MVTRLKIRRKSSIGLYRRNPTSLTRTPFGVRWEERERATPREVQRDFSTRSGGRLVIFSDAVNGVPAAAFVELAGRAVDRGGRLSALFRGTAALCTTHDEFRLRRHGRRRSSPVLYAYAGDIWSFHLIGKVGSVRHHRGWQAPSFRQERVSTTPAVTAKRSRGPPPSTWRRPCSSLSCRVGSHSIS